MAIGAPTTGACCTGNAVSCVDTTEEECDTKFGHTWLGLGTSCADGSCTSLCEGDLTGNGDVGLTDLIAVLSNWGPCPE